MSNFSMYKNETELADMEKTVETNSEKNLVIKPDGRYGLFKITWDDGRGVVPFELSGKYTSQGFAEKAIKTYVDNHRTTKRLKKQEQDRQRDEKIRQGKNYGKPFEESHNEEEEKEVEKGHTQVEEIFSKESFVEKENIE